MKNTGQPIYFMHCMNALSCWKVWQSKVHDYARQFDGQLFTREDILNLRDRCNAVAASCRNHEEIPPVDFAWAEKYGGHPSLSIGGGCSISFHTIKGWYDGK